MGVGLPNSGGPRGAHFGSAYWGLGNRLERGGKGRGGSAYKGMRRGKQQKEVCRATEG